MPTKRITINENKLVKRFKKLHIIDPKRAIEVERKYREMLEVLNKAKSAQVSDTTMLIKDK